MKALGWSPPESLRDSHIKVSVCVSVRKQISFDIVFIFATNHVFNTIIPEITL